MLKISSRYAPIAPIRIYEQLKEQEFLGEYHLLLAHEVVAEPERYNKVFKDLTAKSDIIIMDNSVVELGYPVPLSMMREACSVIVPDYVALPDVLEDCEATLNSIADIVIEPDWIWDGVDAMAIPQGRSIEETLQCARLIHSRFGAGLWGVARWMGTKWGSRKAIVKALYEEYPYIPIHILGFSENIPDDIECAQMPGVIGIDSARPISYGLEGWKLQNAHTDKQSIPRVHRKTSTAWTSAPLNNIVIENMENVRQWISQST